MENLSESQLKTAKTCYNMYLKWQKSLVEKPEKEKTVAHYVKACIEGYPKNTVLQPNILKIRLTGIKNHASVNNIKIDEKVLSKASEILESYKTQYKNKNKSEEEA